MNRKEFIRASSILGASLLSERLFAINLLTGEPEIGIHLPGSNSIIKKRSQAITKGSDLEKYFFDSVEDIKKEVASQKGIITEVVNRFKSYPKGKTRNGLVRKFVNGKIRDVMDTHSKTAVTPAYAHKSDAETFNFTNLCDASIKVVAEDNTLVVQPNDNRPDCSPFIVEEELAYLLKNPIWYCVGLPSSLPNRFDIDYETKKEIFIKTGLETSRPYYMTQDFMFMGKSICGPDGLASGPVKRTIYYQTDNAISKFYDLTSIEACGDPKELKCKIKV
jgi:hypothetical protein